MGFLREGLADILRGEADSDAAWGFMHEVSTALNVYIRQNVKG